ncbi:unnamed protein product [Echinostoma caproni]|uniref:Uncharacterized protein n=1 Tax=Echinostoma caproni TaxID=27848 RepID=A0A183BD15_9TREM|nr:unnamed protein product [Echinostoma caproni]
MVGDTLRVEDTRRLAVFDNRCLRSLAQVGWNEWVSNLEAGRLLGIPDGEVADEFARQLFTRCVQAGSGSSVHRTRRLTEYFATCSVSQAREQRDCLIKALYSSLFDFLVQNINEQLNPGSLRNARREFGESLVFCLLFLWPIKKVFRRPVNYNTFLCLENNVERLYLGMWTLLMVCSPSRKCCLRTFRS